MNKRIYTHRTSSRSAIIGILAAVGVVAYNGYTKSAKESAVRIILNQLLNI